MEASCGKLKCESLYGNHYKTRDATSAGGFENIEVFYNKVRIHDSNGFITPEEYYNRSLNEAKAT